MRQGGDVVLLPDAGPLFTLDYADAFDVLFEDHKIARANLPVPANCRKISTRAYLLFLEEQGYLESAAAIERRAVQAGRAFSALRFPTA